MSQELAKQESKEIFDPELIKKSQQLAGQNDARMPFIPRLTVNNKKERKLVDIDGTTKEVELPAEKGFRLNTKNEETNEYEDQVISGNIKGVILKERYLISKKYIKGEQNFRSAEFDDWNENIKLYDTANRATTVFEGTYSQIRDEYTYTNTKGEKEKAYDLILVLYINYEATKEIFRLELKMNASNPWFKYKATFGENEPWAGYLTEFNLNEKTYGTITYWQIEMKRGEPVDLREQIELQMELNKFFMVKNAVKQHKVFNQEPLMPVEHLPSVQIEEESKEEFQDRVSQIPF